MHPVGYSIVLLFLVGIISDAIVDVVQAICRGKKK
jgi:hypothetical protein